MKIKSISKLQIAEYLFRFMAFLLAIYAFKLLWVLYNPGGELYFSKHGIARMILANDGELFSELIYKQKELEAAILGNPYISASTVLDHPIRDAKKRINVNTPLSAKYYEDYIAPLETHVKLAYSEDEAKSLSIKLTAEDKTALIAGNSVDLSKYGIDFEIHRLKVARALEAILIDNMRKALTEGDQPEDRAG